MGEEREMVRETERGGEGEREMARERRERWCGRGERCEGEEIDGVGEERDGEGEEREMLREREG